MAPRSPRWDKVVVILNLAIITAAALFLLLDRDSVVRHRWQDYSESQRAKGNVRQAWDEVVRAGPWYSAAPGRDTLVIFSDYECPYCRQLHIRLEALQKDGALPPIRYRQLPMPFHSHAKYAARLAVCAEHLGEFAVVHRFLMESDTWQEADTVTVPPDLPIKDQHALTVCFHSDFARTSLAVDSVLAERLQLQGTPSVISRGGIAIGEAADRLLRSVTTSASR